MVVHDFPRFLGNYMHAQTVDTRPLFRWGGGGGLGTRLTYVHVGKFVLAVIELCWCILSSRCILH